MSFRKARDTQGNPISENQKKKKKTFQAFCHGPSKPQSSREDKCKRVISRILVMRVDMSCLGKWKKQFPTEGCIQWLVGKWLREGDAS